MSQAIYTKSVLCKFMSAKKKRGGMSVQEAGRKGGNATKKQYGKEHLNNLLAGGREKLKEIIEKGKEHV